MYNIDNTETIVNIESYIDELKNKTIGGLTALWASAKTPSLKRLLKEVIESIDG